MFIRLATSDRSQIFLDFLMFCLNLSFDFNKIDIFPISTLKRFQVFWSKTILPNRWLVDTTDSFIWSRDTWSMQLWLGSTTQQLTSLFLLFFNQMSLGQMVFDTKRWKNKQIKYWNEILRCFVQRTITLYTMVINAYVVVIWCGHFYRSLPPWF